MCLRKNKRKVAEQPKGRTGVVMIIMMMMTVKVFFEGFFTSGQNSEKSPQFFHGIKTAPH